jgi:hypothetical protein
MILDVYRAKYNKDFYLNTEYKKCLCGSFSSKKLFGYDRYLLKTSVVVCKNCGLIFCNPILKKSFIENLKANSEIKYEQLNKLKNKYGSSNNFIDQSKTREKFILDDMKNKINGILTPISLYIDFSDYKTVLIGSTQKGYPNPQKSKSIFGPYVCRSKKNFFYYPKIIINHPKYSTLANLSNGIVWGGAGINVFGAVPTIYSTASTSDFGSFQLIQQIASYGIPPMINGFCNYISKEKAFNLGAGYSEDVQAYKAKPC